MNPELLYQPKPHKGDDKDWKRSWTHSEIRYQNAARREYHLLLENHRQANHEIVIGYLKKFFIKDILKQFSVIKDWLQQNGIIAYYVVEITRDRFGKSVNRIHYHFLIEYYHSIRSLKRIFKEACRYAGLTVGIDCRVLYKAISDRETFVRKCKYILKYKTYKRRAILFQRKTGINKIGMVNHWFINADGMKANKKTMWQSIVAGWYPDNSAQQKSIRLTIRLTVSIQIR
jgi:hypothetical protein